MKLIKQSKLFFKEGKSDKVYEIDLCQLSDSEYLVNFRYGRRGASLKEGTKTPAAVTEDKAESLFSALEKEKRGKGYQSEAETFVELPQININKPNNIRDTILLRLQDAIEKKNSFKTEWKTSRVIWKASALNIVEAVPFILKLASRGDEMQLYASLCALIQFRTKDAEELFKSYALSSKQKAYIKNMATEGWITIAENTNTIHEIVQDLMEKLPFDVKHDIETNNLESLEKDLITHSNNKNVKYFSELYLLARTQKQILPIVQKIISTWKLEPPYFKNIRSIYKLAQIRKDYKTLALLSYRFEKEKQMFNRNVPLDSPYEYGYSQYFESINKYIEVRKELKKADSLLAFSQFTKSYFQRNSLKTLKAIGESGNAQDYLRLAVSILLEYKESDYSKAKEQPLTEYGSYNYSERKYYYTIGVYPECYDSLLLTNILFGNDSNRVLQKSMIYLTDKYTIKSDSYFYNPSTAERVNTDNKSTTENSSPIQFIKNIFGKKEETTVKTNNSSVDFKLYPEYWETMPQAYIQLLMQGQMNLIHEFAYNNLKKRNDFQELITRLDIESIVCLLTSTFSIPAQLGYDALLLKESELISRPTVVIKILNSPSIKAVEWAKKQIQQNANTYFNELDFTTDLILNSNENVKEWIDDLLKKTSFTTDRAQAILGKMVAEMMHMEDSDENNHIAEIVANRISYLAENHLQHISWSVVEQLVISPLRANILLASHITKQKANPQIIESLPFSLIQLYLQSEIQDVRLNGINLLDMYPISYFEKNMPMLFGIISENPYPDIVQKAINIVEKVVDNTPIAGNDAMQRVVYALVRKETFEGSHNLIISLANNKLKPFWNSGLSPKMLIKLLFSQYRNSQLLAYDILKGYTAIEELSMAQITALASHDLLAVRQWAWNYYKNNLKRIKYERDKSLGILDSKWDDTREFAFHYFKNQFEEKDWNPETLISITDSIRPDVENFGRELITKFFNDENGLEYLTKLSQHPSMNIQALVTNYLTQYASGKIDVIVDLEHYFRSVLARVNKARVAKNRVFKFLENEAINNVDIASVVLPILDDMSAQSTVQDKATCIHILARIKNAYPHLDMHLSIKN